MRSMGTLMGTVRGVCTILPDWHRVTFRHDTGIEIEALAIENCCEGGSKYSGILIFKISMRDVTFLRNVKNSHFEPKMGQKTEQQLK